ncbi:molybdenum cofactor sulfurase 3 isoform X2 [Diachasma alloeum]|uniref:molybdenum cofactor sulfurase 3 isoform X2 n=1 Tax=Diachasma alloeum TaxID=454923 RepID=UPI0007384104|nr:molybdenum cofactor sulfurase 3 isoform X2 [Diachasma alloeum]
MEHVLRPSYAETYDEETVLWLKKEFARVDGEFYLDHAGATLYADSQIRRIAEDLAGSLYANPHSAAGNLTSEIVERTRYRYEDGTLSFLSIISLQHGLDVFKKIPLRQISNHVFQLAKYLHHSLLTLHHRNGKPLAKIYADTDYEDISTQGGTVAFNILRMSGGYVGYMEVLHMAALFKIHLRTGCFCNPGGCQRHLNLSTQDVLGNYDAGYKCGGSKDLIDGRPTGAVRVSFGYSSSFKDVEMLLLMIRKCFSDGPPVVKLPQWWVSSWNERNFRTKGSTKVEGSKVMRKNAPVRANDTERMTNSMRDSSARNDGDGKNNTDGINSSRKLVLSRLYIYPIKSCGAFEISDSWDLTEKGLAYDREWMIINSSGICVTQKQEVRLCLIKPTLCPRRNVLRLDYPGMLGVEVPLEYSEEEVTTGEMCRSRVCGHRVQGVDCGGEVSEWLSLAFGKELRLIRQGRSGARAGGRGELSFSSQAQFLLVNGASVQWLVERIPEGSDCDKEGVLERFRGNMVIVGGQAFEEETWTQVRIGEEVFEVMGPCTRCQMVCIDQQTGLKTIEPLRLLAEEFHGKMKFGIYLTRKNSTSGKIKIGNHLTCM